jgi:hypothetical protein
MNRTRNVLILANGLFTGYVGGRSVHVSSDEKIIEVMADENAALKEKLKLSGSSSKRMRRSGRKSATRQSDVAQPLRAS